MFLFTNLQQQRQEDNKPPHPLPLKILSNSTGIFKLNTQQ